MSDPSASKSVTPGSLASKSSAMNPSAFTVVPPSPSASGSAEQIRFIHGICQEVSRERIENFHRGCETVNPNEPSTELRRQVLDIHNKCPFSISIINNTRTICEILTLENSVISSIIGLSYRKEMRILPLKAAASIISDAYESQDIGKLDSRLMEVYNAGCTFCDTMWRRDKTEEILEYRKKFLGRGQHLYSKSQAMGR